MGFTVAIAGVTGAVGTEMLRVLERRNFPVDELRPLASARSVGKSVTFAGREVAVQELTDDNLRGVDVALFSAGAGISRRFRQACHDAGCLMIDNSSAFRMDDDVPLVVGEVNPDDVHAHKGVIANPNCTTIIMLTALAPLERQVPIRRIVAATYQAASGAGHQAMVELEEETRAVLDGRDYQRSVIPVQYAFNFFPHNSPFNPDCGYCEEELKMLNESRKMLHRDDLAVHTTCVRVPVLRTHGEALNVEFTAPLSVDEAYALLAKAPGVIVHEDRTANRWAMPLDVAGRDEVFVGRIRADRSQANTLDLWVVGDQLLKGAALNAVQVAELALRL